MKGIEAFFADFGWNQDRQKIRNELEAAKEKLLIERDQLAHLKEDFRKAFMAPDHGEAADVIKRRFYQDIEQKEYELYEFFILLHRISDSIYKEVE